MTTSGRITTSGPAAGTAATAAGGAPVSPATATDSGPGRHNRRAGLIGLAVALVAAGVLLALPSAQTDPVAEPGLSTLADVWPDAPLLDVPATLPEGPAYSPAYLLDDGGSVGTGPSADGGSLRLLVRSASADIRELRSLPMATQPQYGGVVVVGDQLAWAETTSDGQGRGRTELWLADLRRSGEPPRRLTADTGDVVFFNSEYDLVLVDGALHWVAVAPGEQTATEIRSVPVGGGAVAVGTEPGAWAMSAWPWLVSAGTGESGPIQLRDRSARRVVDVDAAGTELVSCSPVWCRVLVLGSAGPGRIDLMRPDGSDRQPVATGSVTASIIDVAVLDRFEVLSRSDAQRTATGTQQLLLHDLEGKRTVLVAEGIGMVLYRGGLLWWSAGSADSPAWKALDLRALS